MQSKMKSTKVQTIVGISLVAVFVISAVATSGSGLSLNRVASAGYGSNDNGQDHKSAAERKKAERKRNKKGNKVSQKTVVAKVAEFKAYNAPQHQAAFRTVSNIKRVNPTRFRAIENVFKKYNTVSGRLRVQPSRQTLSVINQYRSYDGYSKYLNYANKLKK